MLSLILTLSVLFPGITESQLLAIFIGGCIAAAVTAIGVRLAIPARPPTPAAKGAGPDGRCGSRRLAHAAAR
jgi:hypothetical protein